MSMCHLIGCTVSEIWLKSGEIQDMGTFLKANRNLCRNGSCLSPGRSKIFLVESKLLSQGEQKMRSLGGEMMISPLL